MSIWAVIGLVIFGYLLLRELGGIRKALSNFVKDTPKPAPVIEIEPEPQKTTLDRIVEARAREWREEIIAQPPNAILEVPTEYLQRLVVDLATALGRGDVRISVNPAVPFLTEKSIEAGKAAK
jgi:hypothetical protein